jgi:HPt (histidine-containing phosphotransfer) domain-containing protein
MASEVFPSLHRPVPTACNTPYQSQGAFTMAQTASTAEPLYSDLASDPDLGEIVEMFVEEMPDRKAALLEQFDSSNRNGLRRTAHQLKGSAGSYGFAPISASAAELEQAVTEDEPEAEIREKVYALIAMCERACAGTPA